MLATRFAFELKSYYNNSENEELLNNSNEQLQCFINYEFVSINVLKATNPLASKAARNYESQEVLDANIIAIHDFNLISVLKKLSS